MYFRFRFMAARYAAFHRFHQLRTGDRERSVLDLKLTDPVYVPCLMQCHIRCHHKHISVFNQLCSRADGRLHGYDGHFKLGPQCLHRCRRRRVTGNYQSLAAFLRQKSGAIQRKGADLFPRAHAIRRMQAVSIINKAFVRQRLHQRMKRCKPAGTGIKHSDRCIPVHYKSLLSLMPSLHGKRSDVKVAL